MSRLIKLLQLEHPNLFEVKKAVIENHFDNALVFYKNYFLSRNETKLYFDEHEQSFLVEFAEKHFPEDINRVRAVAKQVVNQVFVFQEAWDMERTNVPVAFQGEIDWRHIPFQDPEWTYMLNRHHFFVPLGQAYLLTRDERYAQVFCEQISDWIDANPKQSDTASWTWRTIDAAIRSSSWIKALYFFKNSPYFTIQLFEKMLLSLLEHAEYLASNFTNWKAISNWGVIENKALFELSVFLQDLQQANRWRELSLERLKKTASLQIMKDGMHWEQSPLYHNEVLLCYLRTVQLSQNNLIEIDSFITEAARKMAYADLYMAKPNHRQPMKGDSDDFDLRDILTRAAVIFNDSALKFGGYAALDFNNMWELGPQGIEVYENLLAEKPKNLSLGFEASGNFFMRSSWDENALYLYFHCGPLGGGHGHADLFHLDVHAYGKDLLTDLGRYNYSDSYPERQELKRAFAHNTTLVDGIEFTECIDTWGFGRIAEPIMTKWVSEEQFDYVEASHNGYFHFEDPVYVRRKVLFVKPYYWLLVDEFDCKGEHTFSQHFHFSPGEIRLDDTTKNCSIENTDANLCLIPINGEQLTAVIKDGSISYEYNLLEDNKSVEYQLKSSGPAAMMQLIYPQKAANQGIPTITPIDVYDLFGELADERDAQACKILFPDLNEEHLILVCHKKPSIHRMSYMIDGTQVFGEVVLIKRKRQEEVIIVK